MTAGANNAQVSPTELIVGSRPEISQACVFDADLGGGPETVVVVSVSDYSPAAVLRETCDRVLASPPALAVVVVFDDEVPDLTEASALAAALDAPIISRYVAPSSADEVAVARIVGEMIGLERVSMSDHFLDLGGDSMRLLELVNVIEDELEVYVDGEAVRRAPDLAQVARLVSAAREEQYEGSREAPSRAG